jgi:hypothetical protein
MAEAVVVSWNSGAAFPLSLVVELGNSPPFNRLGEEVGLWQLRDQDPLPTWVKGKLIIVGDAAHSSELSCLASKDGFGQRHSNNTRLIFLFRRP